MKSQGLTDAQVAAKIAAGKVNKLPKKATTSTIPQIILKSTFTVFNLVNLVLAVLIILVGSYKNLLFLLIAIANTLISIINEIRAKRTVDKLKLKTEQKPTVIRNGEVRQIPASQIVEGDLLVLSLGDQILVDAHVETGELEVNESFITGEQDNVEKRPGDRLISGSFVVAGTCQAIVTSVGAQNYLTKLEASAKTIKPQKSQLFTIMNNIVKYISIALIPIGILLLVRQLSVQDFSADLAGLNAQSITSEVTTDSTSAATISSNATTSPNITPETVLTTLFNSPRIETAVTSTVAALINMIPEGLILLTSGVLALATIRLSRRKVLVQDLYSIETLARVDTICIDKTGTLTTGHMKVKDFIPYIQSSSEAKSTQAPQISVKSAQNPAKPSEKAYNSALKSLQNAFMAILSRSTSDNATSAALRAKLPKTAKFEPTEPIFEYIPFSSDRKYSGIKTQSGEILMGALEFITKDPATLATAQNFLKSVDHPENYRIISVVKRQNKTTKTDQSPQKSLENTSETLLGFALLEDEIRPDAPKIIKYFADNDVAVKIISGDNLETVQNIAEKVKVPDAQKAIDLSIVGPHPNYSSLARTYQIFARVTPSQKKQLVRALKQQGHTVAMTGDGVNDILAMKEADCSIAIGAGADAARRTARLVLLDSDFASVPSIIAEGRQSINNLERSTTLFLTKTIYASILAVCFVIFPLEYPYSPIEMSLLNFLCIGFPGFVLALETNTARVKDRFVANIKKYSVPTGLTIAAAMLLLATLDRVLPLIIPSFTLARPDLLTISMVATFIIDISLIYRISKPLNAFRATLLALIIAIFLAAVLIPPIRLLFIS